MIENISAATYRFPHSICPQENGDTEITWTIKQELGYSLTTKHLEQMTGIDRELFHVRPFRNEIVLHVPAMMTAE